MPNTHLILHVKGTEAETAELPKDAVRAAISQGKLTHSQLIWSPAANAWKQAREFPELLPVEHLILHVKGTESETQELSMQEVRAAVSEGKLTHSQLIWSPKANAWKQVREMPGLLPSQKLAPAPVPARKVAVAVSTTPVARALNAIVPGSADTPKPRVAVASAKAPTVKAKTPHSVQYKKSYVVKEEDHSHPVKWLCIGLGILIAVVSGANYIMVDQPLASNFGQTSYSDVSVYAHFGAFMQPNVIVIHIPASSKITPGNLTDVLVALARSTPESPISHDVFARVALTSGWTAKYSFSGYSWKELGDMQKEGEDQRKEFLLAQLGNAGGESLMPESTLDERTQKATRDQVWKDFVAYFTGKS